MSISSAMRWREFRHERAGPSAAILELVGARPRGGAGPPGAGAVAAGAPRAARARRPDPRARVPESVAAHPGLLPGGDGTARRQLLRHHAGPGNLAARDARSR